MLAFQEGAQHLALRTVEIGDEEAGIIGIIDIRIVLRTETVKTKVPGALLVVQGGVQVETQVVAARRIAPPVTRCGCLAQFKISHLMIEVAAVDVHLDLNFGRDLEAIRQVVQVALDGFDIHGQCRRPAVARVVIAIVQLDGVMTTAEPVTEVIALALIFRGRDISVWKFGVVTALSHGSQLDPVLLIAGVQGGVQMVAVIDRLGTADNPAAERERFGVGKATAVGSGIDGATNGFLGHAHGYYAPVNLQ